MTIKLNTTQKVVPMIYAYSTPEVVRHDGWTKIGYTEQDVSKRIEQQTHTADVTYKEEWRGTAVYDDGSGDTFTDKAFHSYLRKNKIEQESGKNNEWFRTTGPESRIMFYDFRSNRGIMGPEATVIPYELREEQVKAVAETIAYKGASESNTEFLWNAKPRFGKSLSAYDFCKEINAEKVLIVTNRPAIANSWFSDYAQFLGKESGYLFVSEVDALKGLPGVLSREEYIKAILHAPEEQKKIIEFVSLQDMKGSIYFGGNYDKLKEISDKSEMEWDVLIIDEAHEGVDTYKTDTAFNHIMRKFTLHLSGTPFKALANDKFKDNAIFNWTYADEQQKKYSWDEEHPGEENPYALLPQLNLFTYQMSEIVRDEIKQGVEINGETEEFAFDLNEFFSTTNGRFVYDSAVTKFLDALTTQEKFPFSSDELRNKLKHTFWLLNRVESAKALARKLSVHPVFGNYTIILAAGDGMIDDEDESEKSFNKVKKAIAENDRTITLSVGQLTTGVTIPEWTAVLMLSNIKSPSLYMQAAFRAQNPCLFYDSAAKEHLRKENAYVFDFDPARTLMIFEEFANDLSSGTTSGKGDVEKRKQNIMTLLNFFPVIGEDEEGKMIELDADKVMSIPRKIKSQEVVRRGFMSNFLFQNISNVFNAPAEVIEIITSLTPASEPNKKAEVTPNTKKNLSIDENGEVNLTEEYVIGKSADLFGDKIYKIEEEMASAINLVKESSDGDDNATFNALKEKFKTNVINTIVETAKTNYGSDIKISDEKQMTRDLSHESEKQLNQKFSDYTIDKNTIEAERTDALKERFTSGKTETEINKEYDERRKKAVEILQQGLKDVAENFTKEAAKEVVKTIETKIKERVKITIEDAIRDHLRGFSRTIPSFLMAYGDDSVTLATFDQKVPDKVFVEVTSITLEQFKFLRDGGEYEDAETHEMKRFSGQLFDAVVFDDSVKEFLRLKKKLSNYFDESAIEDIFDYIPPQKTNQIFTPKDIVKKMVDMLEAENPGCFDDPDKTFIDLYMKSGLYITEIVKRLFNSPKMKEDIPDDTERLRYIFENQVYGLAPTEIIYNIAKSYILGFSDEIPIEKHNLKLFDSLPASKDGTLSEKLDELFGKHE